MQVPEAGTEQALQHMQDLRLKNGSSLYMGEQLLRTGQLQVVPRPLAIDNDTACLWGLPGLLHALTPGPEAIPKV